MAQPDGNVQLRSPELQSQKKVDWGWRKSQLISFSRLRALQTTQNAFFGPDRGVAKAREQPQ